MLLRHIVCKEGLLVDPLTIVLILSFSSPTNVKMLQATLGHTGYYHKFIKGYASITAPMEKLLNKDVAFEWIQECQSRGCHIFPSFYRKLVSKSSPLNISGETSSALWMLLGRVKSVTAGAQEDYVG